MKFKSWYIIPIFACLSGLFIYFTPGSTEGYFTPSRIWIDINLAVILLIVLLRKS